MIEVKNIRKEYAAVIAVDDVSFSVQRGNIFGLIGPNGAGKTTTIRMIMNIIQPDRGSITIDGRLTTEAVKNVIGYLPEERGLYRKNKLINAIAYLGSLKGLTLADAKRRAMPLLERFQLTQYAGRKIEELSKGNQQKVQFIVSVLHDPPILVLDELFSGLDPINQDLMKDVLLSLKRENRAIIFSTHQMEQAEKLCDDLCLINKGKIVLDGSPASIRERFGKNAVRVEFSGDLPDTQIDGIERARLYGSYAEMELAPNASTNTVLASLMPHVMIRRFERVEPSLHSIFIDVVGSDDAAIASQPKHDPKPPMLVSRHPKVKRALVSLLVIGIVTVVLGISSIAKPDLRSTALMLAGFALITLFQYLSIRKKAKAEMLRQAEGGNGHE